MRLLHTTTLQLHEFFGNEEGREIPGYAILSHTWEAEECTFKEVRDGRGRKKKGYRKIVDSCTLAKLLGYRWLWVDTCCIDKTSSAELSEAINSMFVWYRESRKCLVFLADVPGGLSLDAHKSTSSAFRRSRWFTRGWTLQELLAPKSVVFFDSEWRWVGPKEDLDFLLTEITGIEHLFGIEEASIAQRMSWISQRKTTRIEDLAYSMLGILGVNMPPLYGEGINAFLRLQLELIKSSDDESIFAWKVGRLGHPLDTRRGMLALHPNEFRHSENVERYDFDQERPPYSMTNKGLHFQVPVVQISSRSDLHPGSEVNAVPLNCRFKGQESPIIIFLKRDFQMGPQGKGTETVRISSDLLFSRNQIEESRVPREIMHTAPIYVKQSKPSSAWQPEFITISVEFLSMQLNRQLKHILFTHPHHDHWHETGPAEIRISLLDSHAVVMIFVQELGTQLSALAVRMNFSDVYIKAAKIDPGKDNMLDFLDKVEKTFLEDDTWHEANDIATVRTPKPHSIHATLARPKVPERYWLLEVS